MADPVLGNGDTEVNQTQWKYYSDKIWSGEQSEECQGTKEAPKWAWGLGKSSWRSWFLRWYQLDKDVIVSVCVSTCMCNMPHGKVWAQITGEKTALVYARMNDHSSLILLEQKAQSSERWGSRWPSMESSYILPRTCLHCHLKNYLRYENSDSSNQLMGLASSFASRTTPNAPPPNYCQSPEKSLVGPDGNLFPRFISKDSQELSI